MIITVTPNPSLDKTVELSSALLVGEVQRAVGQRAEPGGKGVNISRALSAAGEDTLAVLPGDPADPVIRALQKQGVNTRALQIGAALRTNIAITDPSGTTTKINEPGPAFTAAMVRAMIKLIVEEAAGASWVALAGSLPPGVPADFYCQVMTELRSESGRDQAPRIAVDASGHTLARAIRCAPELIKPNAEELLELAAHFLEPADLPGLTPAELEADGAAAAHLVHALQRHGVQAALVTLGAHGALYVPAAAEGTSVLIAQGPPLVVRSTVGAGDASLAGYLSAHQRGGTAADCLRQAMAQGRAAAALPGSTMPGPEHLEIGDVVVEELTP